MSKTTKDRERPQKKKSSAWKHRREEEILEADEKDLKEILRKLPDED